MVSVATGVRWNQFDNLSRPDHVDLISKTPWICKGFSQWCVVWCKKFSWFFLIFPMECRSFVSRLRYWSSRYWWNGWFTLRMVTEAGTWTHLMINEWSLFHRRPCLQQHCYTTSLKNNVSEIVWKRIIDLWNNFSDLGCFCSIVEMIIFPFRSFIAMIHDLEWLQVWIIN